MDKRGEAELEKKRWQRLVRLANAESTDESELAHAHLSLIKAWGIFPLWNGLPYTAWNDGLVPSLAKEARSIQVEVRLLLRWMSRQATNAQAKAARQILEASHSYELKWVNLPPAMQGAVPVPISQLEAIQSKTDRHTFFIRAKAAKREKLRDRYQVPDYQRPLDIVCGFIREARDQRQAREPIRLCQLPSCGRFFFRWRKKLFCSSACLNRAYQKRRQLSRVEMRDYMREYRKRKRGGQTVIASTKV